MLTQEIKIVSIKLDNGKVTLVVDLNQDGQPLLSLSLDLSEAGQELLKLLIKK